MTTASYSLSGNYSYFIKVQQQVTVGSKMVRCPPASTRARSPTEVRSLSVTRGEDGCQEELWNELCCLVTVCLLLLTSVENPPKTGVL